ncbi:hypothetical protein [uncultured Parabacteroides sp.]|jgi:hypothetical protein|uniref:hypothetical protein n=1 Tax=uncultured Parabacteroides sp. TaxID=512312 RepID=UPI0025FEC33A|nr:hypothetical protein [uncultured Parabacteroides sp.]
MKKVLVLLFIISCFSCGRKQPLPVLDIEKLQNIDCIVLDDSPGYQIRNYGALFLDSTSGFHPKDLSKMTVMGESLYVLADGELRCYEFPSGKLRHRFLSSDSFSSFALDTLTSTLYGLDGRTAELVSFSSDGKENGRMLLDRTYTYTGVDCTGGGQLVLLTDEFPDPAVFRIRTFGGEPVRLPIRGKGRKPTTLPDSMACPLQVAGNGVEGRFYKYLLNDTLYLLKGDSCLPVFTCNMGKDGARLGNKTHVLKNNRRLCITGFWETKDYWWIQYRSDYLVKEKLYRSTTMAILYKDLKIKDSGYEFFIQGQTIAMDTRFPVYLNEEGTCFLQIYDPADHLKEGKKELPYNLENAPDRDNLILNYFYWVPIKNKKR